MWPRSGQSAYITPAAWGVPTASERRADSQVAHKWARWLCNPVRLGDHPVSQRRAVSEVPTSGQCGYMTPTAWGVPTA